MEKDSDADALPWSFRLGTFPKLLICSAAGAAVGLIGTLTYRAGVGANMPYGLVLALCIVTMSAWCARSRSGVAGLALHLIVSSLMVWLLSSGVNGNILVPGYTVQVPFLIKNAGYIWLLGMVAIQAVMVVLPAQWFAIVPASSQRVDKGGEGSLSGASHHKERDGHAR